MALDQVPHLFVEGKDDENVVVQLLMRHGLFAHAHHGPPLSRFHESNVQVVVEYPQSHKASSGSKEELLEDITPRVRNSKAAAIGYIVDADDPTFTEWSLQRTWQSIRDRLAHAPASVVTPDVIPIGGFLGVHTGIGTPIGVWIMPDNLSDGTIEHFLRGLVDAGDVLLPFAESSTRGAKDQHQAPFGEKDFQKATLASWLAWQDPPGLPYGTALKRECFRHDTETALRFVDWVKRLIGIP